MRCLKLPDMGIKTWKIGVKAAGKHVRGRVIVASPSGDLDGFGKEVGTEIVGAINEVAKQWRPGRNTQAEEAEVAETLASITVAASLPLLGMREARTADSLASAAEMMADLCQEALLLEPRFICLHALAVTARERANAGYMQNAQELCNAISWALPQPVERAGEADRVMRVEIKDLAFPKPSAALKDAGLAELTLSVKCEEVDGSEVGRHPSTVYFPVQLFRPKQPEPALFVEMWVGELQVIVELETKRPAYGALRDMVFAVEEVVESRRFGRLGQQPA